MLRGKTVLALSLILSAFAWQILAHDGIAHVTGTVMKVEGKTVTVKTVKGEVDVMLTDKTEITKDDQKTNAADLKVGTKVTVNVPEGSKPRVAQSIRVATAGAASHAAHEHGK